MDDDKTTTQILDDWQAALAGTDAEEDVEALRSSMPYEPSAQEISDGIDNTCDWLAEGLASGRLPRWYNPDAPKV